jgi:predicted GH43/DUF377 family glycosyl hydrolase
MDNIFSYKDKSILYICQNGTSGYANAAKGYIYDYIGKKIPVKTQYFNCSDEINENDKFHQYLNSNTSSDIEYNTIIVHSTPDIWTTVVKNAPNINLENKTIIGRTVWEFEKLLPSWVDSINTSIVDIVSVPTEWNKQCFINSGVLKPIIVEPHVYVDYPHKKVGLTVLSKKSIVISKDENLTGLNLNEYYKFYCIGQFIERKGIVETIDAFCNAFTSADKVVLFVKTFKLNYNNEEKQKCLLEIVNIADKYNHAPIIYIKDSLNYDEIKSLHDIGDCYFHLTKTEGFCLGAFDAFNNSKKVIITGYGGHTEYLGKNYDGLVNYKLNPLSVNNSVFFQFKLDDTYKWAIADKKNAIELLKFSFFGNNETFYDKYQISIGNGFYDIEYDDKKPFRWMGKCSEFYINHPMIKSIDLELESLSEKSFVKVNGYDQIVNYGINKITISGSKVETQQSFFIPNKINPSLSDGRELSFRLFNININYKDGKSKTISIKDVKYMDKFILNIINKNLHGYISDKLQTSIFKQSNDIKILNLPYTNKNFYFNSCIFKGAYNKVFLMARESVLIDVNKFKNTLKLYELDCDYNITSNLNLKIVDEIENEQYEDPRVIFYNDRYYVGCANYQYGKIKFIHQKVLVFDKDFNHIDNIHIEYDGNGSSIKENKNNQKNWTFFIHKENLMVVYKMNPHIILEIDLKTKKLVSEYKNYQDIDEMWDFGECRMGSNPILKDGYYHNFFHSSLPWRFPKRQYFMGYYKFESFPPFKIVEIKKEPILYGNEADDRVLKDISPLVIFPCGAIEKDGKFVVSFGLNDEKTGIIKYENI